MAIGAFRLWLNFRGWSLRLVVIEIEIPPSMRRSKSLRILDCHIGAIEGSGKIAPSRRLGPRAIRILGRQRELQLLVEDRSLGKDARLLVNLKGSRLDIDVVELGEVGVTIIESIRRQRRADIHPIAVTLGKDQLTGRSVFGQVSRLGRHVAVW